MMALLPAVAQATCRGMLHADDGQPDGPRLCEPLAAGLTICELAVAQTGGQGQLAGPTGGRLLFLLPPLHVAPWCMT